VPTAAGVTTASANSTGATATVSTGDPSK
jgi:hypothetical protein